MNIIAFTGLAGSGKDTAAQYLIDSLPNCKKIALADAVKDVASDVFGWPRPLLQGDTQESRVFRETPDEYWSEKLGKPFTPRLALQLIGTECFRKPVDESVWVYVLERKILKYKDTDTTILITDVRFPNELEMVHRLGGKAYRVIRGDLPSWYECAKIVNQDIKKYGYTKHFFKELNTIHVSETSLIGLDLEDDTLYNNGSLEEFHSILQGKFLR